MSKPTPQEPGATPEIPSSKDAVQGINQHKAVILESIMDAFYALDQKGNFTYINKQAEQVLQRARRNLLGKNIWQEFPEAVGSKLYREYNTALRTGTSRHFELFYPRSNGWFQVHVYPSSDGLSVYFDDITQRKKAEQERDELLVRERAARAEAEVARQRLHDLFMQAPALICVTRGPQHKIELMNPPLVQLSGNRDYHGKTLREFSSVLAGQIFFDLIDSVYATGEPFIGNEMRLIVDPQKSGNVEERYFNFVVQRLQNAPGEIDGLHLHGIEVTEQVRARQTVQRSQQRLELAQQAAHIGTFEWDIPKNHILWTPELEALYGLPPGAFEGKYETWARRVHPDDRPRVEESVQTALAGGPPYNAEFRVILPDGSTRWVLAKGDVYYDADQKPERMIGINMDITERKALEQRKNDFISMASHELKTPITTIRGFTQMLRRRFKQREDEHALHFLTRMDAQLDRLRKLISDLLDTSKIEAGSLPLCIETFDLAALVQETVDDLQGVIRQQIRIESLVDAQVVGDRDRIGQVLMNLLTNAAKYSREEDAIVLRISRTQDEAVVSVHDSGIGIAEAYQQYVFDRFYQVTEPAEKTYPGLGIGLYIARNIIERHHGRIWVESTKGAGSTFSFSIPL